VSLYDFKTYFFKTGKIKGSFSILLSTAINSFIE
jgi:hypothetical protein